MKYRFTYDTHIGGRAENQDAVGTTDAPFGRLIVICDGMGGPRGGSIAAQMAVEGVIHEIEQSTMVDARTALHIAIQKANFEIFKKSKTEEGLDGMGTTIAVLLLMNDKALIAHVGDSRIYHVREGKILSRTSDHSKVNEMVSRGIISTDEARIHPDANVITKALGVKPIVELEFQETSFLANDLFILCTDGIWGMVDETEMIQYLQDTTNLENGVHQIIQDIDTMGRQQNSEYDNMTVAVLRTGSDARSTPVGSMSFNGSSWQLKNLLLIGSALLNVILLGLIIWLALSNNTSPTTEGPLDQEQGSDTLQTLEKLSNYKSQIDSSLEEQLADLLAKDEEIGSKNETIESLGDKNNQLRKRIKRLAVVIDTLQAKIRRSDNYIMTYRQEMEAKMIGLEDQLTRQNNVDSLILAKNQELMKRNDSIENQIKNYKEEIKFLKANQKKRSKTNNHEEDI